MSDIKNRYIIIPNPNPNSAIWDIIVGGETGGRHNNQGNKIIVKLPVGDHEDNHAILNGFPSYSHAEIMVELQKPEWVDDSAVPG